MSKTSSMSDTISDIFFEDHISSHGW